MREIEMEKYSNMATSSILLKGSDIHEALETHILDCTHLVFEFMMKSDFSCSYRSRN